MSETPALNSDQQGLPTIHLVPMKPDEFEPFMDLSMREQAEGQVQTGRWGPEEADALIQSLRKKLLPNGLDTPHHYFFTLEKMDTGEKAGVLWFTVEEEAGEKALFVMDIQVYPPFRRQGLATQAFELMELEARKMEVPAIRLHVFRENRGARSLYEKLGYAGTDELMVKRL